MPSRKSDQGRKSDVSVARFVVVDEDGGAPTTADPSSPRAEPSRRPLPEASPSSDGVPTDAEPEASPAAAPATSPGVGQEEKKDKPKDKESEKKEAKDKSEKDATTIEDLNLPRSVITRLAKGVLPQGTQVQGNAILALTKSATVFVNYIASHANEHTVNAGKKTIDASHVFKALEDTELDFLKGPLEAEFAKFSQNKSAKRVDYRQRKKAETNPAGAGDDSHMGDVSAMSGPDAADETLSGPSAHAADDGGQQPRAKKAKTAAATAAAATAVGAGGVAAFVATGAGDNAETEPEEEEEEDDDDDQEEQEEEDDAEEEDEDEDESEEESGDDGDETQDAVDDDDERGQMEVDEALDGDESD